MGLSNGFPLNQKRVNVNGEIFPYAPAGDTIPEIYYGKRSDDISADQEFQNMRNQFKNMIGRDHMTRWRYLIGWRHEPMRMNQTAPSFLPIPVKENLMLNGNFPAE